MIPYLFFAASFACVLMAFWRILVWDPDKDHEPYDSIFDRLLYSAMGLLAIGVMFAFFS